MFVSPIAKVNYLNSNQNKGIKRDNVSTLLNTNIKSDSISFTGKEKIIKMPNVSTVADAIENLKTVVKGMYIKTMGSEEFMSLSAKEFDNFERSDITEIVMKNPKIGVDGKFATPGFKRVDICSLIFPRNFPNLKKATMVLDKEIQELSIPESFKIRNKAINRFEKSKAFTKVNNGLYWLNSNEIINQETRFINEMIKEAKIKDLKFISKPL